MTTGVNAAASVLTQFETRAQAIGRSIARVGDQITQSLTLPIAGLGVASGKAAMDFEQSMQPIVGLVGVSQQQVDAWKQQLLTLGPALSRGPKELADALYFTTSAGLKTGEAMDVVEKSARAAAAGLGETQVIADATSSALNAYGTSNLSAGKAVGILVATVREGKAEANQIAPALGRVIPIAAQLGISFDQVGAAMAAMTLVGFDAAESATNLSGIMAALLKPSKQASDTLAEFGLSGESLRQTLKEHGLLGVLMMLKDTIGQNDEALAKIFPNIRGFRGLLSLVGENAEQAREVFAKLAGTTEEDLNRAFEVASNTAKFKFDAAMAGVQADLIKLGDAVLPAVIPLLQSLGKTIDSVATGFSNLSPETQQLIVHALALVAALGPVLSIGGRMIDTLGTLAGAVRTTAGLFVSLGSGLLSSVQTLRTFAEVEGRAATASEVLKIGLSSVAAQVAVIAAAVVVMIKFLDAAGKAAAATNDELLKLANANTGNVIEDIFTRAGASFEMMVNGSKRLREAFVAHQDEMRQKLLDGNITLQEYNAEIERSAKAAGLWRNQFEVGRGNVEKIDRAVKTLTADEVRLAQAQASVTQGAYGQSGALDESERAARRAAEAQRGLGGAMQEVIDQASAQAEAQQKLAEEQTQASAKLDQLRALIDGQVGPAYDTYKKRSDELREKQRALREELAKLEAQQGRQITTQKKGALSANELRLAQEQLASAQAKLASETNPLKQAELAVKIDTLTAKIQGADSATTTWVDNSKRIGEIRGELSELDTALKENADASDERLKRILLNMVTEQLAADGLTATEVEALTGLAEKWGLIDDATATATRGILTATAQLARDGNIQTFVDNMTNALDDAKEGSKRAGPEIAGPVGEAWLEATRAAKENSAEVSEATKQMATAVGEQTKAAGGALSGLAGNFSETKTAVSTQAFQMRADADTAIGAIASTFKQYGPSIGEPLKTGFKATRTDVIASLNDILSKIAEVISALTGLRVSPIRIPSGGGETGGTPAGGASPTPGRAPSPTPACFVAGTPIVLADGKQKPIEQIRAGDHVLAFDTVRREFVDGRVIRSIKRTVSERLQIVFASGLSIEVTGEHPFYLPERRTDAPVVHDEFVRARDLRPGDRPARFDRGEVGAEIIEQVTALTGTVDVFNFNVEPCHTYVAGGLIVHNVKVETTRPFTIPTPIPALPFAAANPAQPQQPVASNIYVTIPVGNISSEVDIEMLAYRVAQRIARRR